MFTIRKEEIKGIHFIFISQEGTAIKRTSLEPRNAKAKTVPGTRSFPSIITRNNLDYPNLLFLQISLDYGGPKRKK